MLGGKKNEWMRCLKELPIADSATHHAEAQGTDWVTTAMLRKDSEECHRSLLLWSQICHQPSGTNFQSSSFWWWRSFDIIMHQSLEANFHHQWCWQGRGSVPSPKLPHLALPMLSAWQCWQSSDMMSGNWIQVQQATIPLSFTRPWPQVMSNEGLASRRLL